MSIVLNNMHVQKRNSNQPVLMREFVQKFVLLARQSVIELERLKRNIQLNDLGPKRGLPTALAGAATHSRAPNRVGEFKSGKLMDAWPAFAASNPMGMVPPINR